MCPSATGGGAVRMAVINERLPTSAACGPQPHLAQSAQRPCSDCGRWCTRSCPACAFRTSRTSTTRSGSAAAPRSRRNARAVPERARICAVAFIGCVADARATLRSRRSDRHGDARSSTRRSRAGRPSCCGACTASVRSLLPTRSSARSRADMQRFAAGFVELENFDEEVQSDIAFYGDSALSAPISRFPMISQARRAGPAVLSGH